MDQAAYHAEQLEVQHRLYDILDKAEKQGFTPDDLSLMAIQFGIQYKPKLNPKRNRYESRIDDRKQVSQKRRFGLRQR